MLKKIAILLKAGAKVKAEVDQNQGLDQGVITRRSHEAGVIQSNYIQNDNLAKREIEEGGARKAQEALSLRIPIKET